MEGWHLGHEQRLCEFMVPWRQPKNIFPVQKLFRIETRSRQKCVLKPVLSIKYRKIKCLYPLSMHTHWRRWFICKSLWPFWLSHLLRCVYVCVFGVLNYLRWIIEKLIQVRGTCLLKHYSCWHVRVSRMEMVFGQSKQN